MWKFATSLKTRIKTRKIHLVLGFNQSQWLKPYTEFNTQERIKVERNRHKGRKALYKLINDDVYGKIMGSLRNRIDLILVNNKKDYLKQTSKPSYMSHKIFHNVLDPIRKTKATLTLNKPAYAGMCIWVWVKY